MSQLLKNTMNILKYHISNYAFCHLKELSVHLKLDRRLYISTSAVLMNSKVQTILMKSIKLINY